MTGKFVKHSSDKVRPDLLPPRAILAVSDVLRFGAEKYAPNNWKKAPSWSTYSGAALRHIFEWLSGVDVDAESGLHPLAHALCCLLFLLEFVLTKMSIDDRGK